jgi:hypothetical protein
MPQGVQTDQQTILILNMFVRVVFQRQQAHLQAGWQVLPHKLQYV